MTTNEAVLALLRSGPYHWLADLGLCSEHDPHYCYMLDRKGKMLLVGTMSTHGHLIEVVDTLIQDVRSAEGLEEISDYALFCMYPMHDLETVCVYSCSGLIGPDRVQMNDMTFLAQVRVVDLPPALQRRAQKI